MQHKLKQLTKQLLEYNEAVLRIAEDAANSEAPPDFYGEVKPFADEVKRAVDEWKKEAIAWIEAERPKHVHPQQIEAAGDNLEKMAVEAFYPAAKRRRLKQFHQSVAYTLELISERLGASGDK
jgi:hypothetical protein